MLLTGLLAFPAIAAAQAAPAGMAPAATPAPAGGPSSGRGMEMAARRIRDLHDRLKVTPAQQPSWDAFAAVMLDNAQRMDALHASLRSANAAPSAVDDMRGYARAARQHADDVQRLILPFEALYAVMSPDQKRLTDQNFRQFEAREERRHARGP